MYEVVLLTLGDAPERAGGPTASASADRTPTDPADHGAARGGCDCGSGSACGRPRPRVPVLACADALTTAGAKVEMITAESDSEIDAVLARLDGPGRDDGLPWPDGDGRTRLVLAAATDGQIRAVLRRLVRRYAPPPRQRPADLPAGRTVPDLPPVGLLPLDPTGAGSSTDLVARLGLPRTPADVAAAVLAGRSRRLDLLRTDAGSVTLDGALLGMTGPDGQAEPWQARVEVDDAVLSDGTDPLLACVVANADGYAVLDGLPLVTAPDPGDGVVEVAVAVPVLRRSFLRGSRIQVEIRRARGRAASVTPRGREVPYLDDGVAGRLGRRWSWWIEPAAWAVFTGTGRQ